MKETYCSKIKVLSKENLQDDTISAIDFNDIKMTLKVIRKNINQILFMKMI